MALVLASCADSHSLGASHEFVQSDECEAGLRDSGEDGADTRDATDRRGLTTGPGHWDAPRARRRLWAFARGVTNNVRPATVT